MIDIEEIKFFYLNKGKKAKKIKRVGDYKNSTNSKCFKIRLGNNDYLLKVITGGDDYQVKCSFMPQCFESGELKFDDENYKYYLYEYIDGFVISENNKYKLNEKSFESLINLEICLHNKGVCIFDMNAYNFIHTPNDRIVPYFALFRQDFDCFMWYILKHRHQNSFSISTTSKGGFVYEFH